MVYSAAPPARTAMPALPDATDCIEYAGPGGAEVLRLARRPLPSPGPRQVLLEVAFAGINRPDLLQREGRYPPPPGVTDIPGLEVAGRVVAAGDEVGWPRVGEEVCALLAGGGYARFALAEADLCLPIPQGCDLAAAAAIPEAFFTVWFNLVEKGGLDAGQTVLIHGGASGIGTTAIQVARAFGATVYTTAGSDEKCRACEALGAARAFNYRREDFAEVKALTGGRGVDLVLDMVGGDYLARHLRCTTRGARIVQIAFLGGSRVTADLMPLMLKELVLTGSTLRSQPLAVKARLARKVRDQLLPLVAAGRLKPVVDRVFPLEEAAAAQRYLESGAHFGKVILRCRH